MLLRCVTRCFLPLGALLVQHFATHPKRQVYAGAAIVASGQKLALEHGHVENNRRLSAGEEWGGSRVRHSKSALFPARTWQSAGQDAVKLSRGCTLTAAETFFSLPWCRATSSGTAESAGTCIHAPTMRRGTERDVCHRSPTINATARLQRGGIALAIRYDIYCARAPRTAAPTSLREPALEVFPMSTTPGFACRRGPPGPRTRKWPNRCVFIRKTQFLRYSRTFS